MSHRFQCPHVGVLGNGGVRVAAGQAAGPRGTCADNGHAILVRGPPEPSYCIAVLVLQASGGRADSKGILRIGRALLPLPSVGRPR